MRRNTCTGLPSSSVSATLFLDHMHLTRLPAEGILALHDQKLRDLYDLKVTRIWPVHPYPYFPSCSRFSYNAIRTLCWHGGSSVMSRNGVGASKVSLTSSSFLRRPRVFVTEAYSKVPAICQTIIRQLRWSQRQVR